MKRISVLIVTFGIMAFAVVMAAVDPGVAIVNNTVIKDDTITARLSDADWEEVGALTMPAMAGSDTNYVVMVSLSGVAELNRSEELIMILTRNHGDTFYHQQDSATHEFSLRGNQYARGALPQDYSFNWDYAILDSNTTDTVKVAAAIGGGRQVIIRDFLMTYQAIRK